MHHKNCWTSIVSTTIFAIAVILVSGAVGEKTRVGPQTCLIYEFASTSLGLWTHALVYVMNISKQSFATVLFGDIMNNDLLQFMSRP